MLDHTGLVYVKCVKEGCGEQVMVDTKTFSQGYYACPGHKGIAINVTPMLTLTRPNDGQ